MALRGIDATRVDFCVEHLPAEGLKEQANDQPADDIIWDASLAVGFEGAVVAVSGGEEDGGSS